MANNDNAAMLAAVAIKIPDFWQSNPTGWFRSIEAQFTLRNINQDITKYNYVLSALGNEASAAVEGFLANPPANDLYNAIKQELLAVYGITDKQKKRLLINLVGLGDRKPTEHLRYMKSLHRADNNDALFMALFMQQLPSPVRTILAGRDFDDINDLAKAADDIMVEQATVQAAVSHQPTIVNRAKPQVTTTDLPSTPGLCWYHRKYADKATRCRQPCSWPGNAMASH